MPAARFLTQTLTGSHFAREARTHSHASSAAALIQGTRFLGGKERQLGCFMGPFRIEGAMRPAGLLVQLESRRRAGGTYRGWSFAGSSPRSPQAAPSAGLHSTDGKGCPRGLPTARSHPRPPWSQALRGSLGGASDLVCSFVIILGIALFTLTVGGEEEGAAESQGPLSSGTFCSCARCNAVAW